MATYGGPGRGRGGAAVAATRAPTAQKTEYKILPRIGGKVHSKRLAIFTRQFSVMLDAGLPLVQCLDILASQEEQKVFQQILFQVKQDVEGGLSLADAMAKHPKAFDKLYVSMIAAGESGGILDVILQRLSTYLEKSVKLKSQVKSALIYPVAVIAIAVIVVWIILWKVVPVFAQLFAGVGAELPLPTRIVIAASNIIGNYSTIIIPLIIVFMIGYKWAYDNTEGVRYFTDKMLLKIPVIGDLLRKIAIARFCRTLSTLTSSGVPLLEGLEITAKTAGNAVIEEAIFKVRKAVEEGRTVSEPLGETGVFPAMVVHMIAVGEQTGALDAMLSKIADFYEDEVDTAVAGLMKLIEPLLIAFLGVVIGFIVAAMYMPMYSLLKHIG